MVLCPPQSSFCKKVVPCCCLTEFRLFTTVKMLAASSERSTSLFAYSITLIILSTVAVIMRLISRRISAARFWWESVFSEPTFRISTQILSLETSLAGLYPQNLYLDSIKLLKVGDTDGDIVFQRRFHCDQFGMTAFHWLFTCSHFVAGFLCNLCHGLHWYTGRNLAT